MREGKGGERVTFFLEWLRRRRGLPLPSNCSCFSFWVLFFSFKKSHRRQWRAVIVHGGVVLSGVSERK